MASGSPQAQDGFEIPQLHVQPLPAADSPGSISLPGGVTMLPDITYKTVPGYRPLKLDLYLPPQSGGHNPLVLWVHGGGFLVGDPRNDWTYGDWRMVLAELSSRGYVVAGVTYRLSAEAPYPAQLEDVRDALKFLNNEAERWHIETGKTVAWGLSAGGHLVSDLATSCTGDRCVAGVVNWFGPTDLTKMGDGEPVRMLLDCGANPCPEEKLLMASPAAKLRPGLPPIVLMHGEDDSLVPVEQSIDLAARLDALGVRNRLLVYPKMNHGFEGGTPEQLREILVTTFEQIDWLLE